MFHSRVGSQELTVEGGVAHLGGGELLGVESKRSSTGSWARLRILADGLNKLILIRKRQIRGRDGIHRPGGG